MALIVDVLEVPIKGEHVLIRATNLFITALASLFIFCVGEICFALLIARLLSFIGCILAFVGIKFSLLCLCFKSCNI